jgi:hypothetical protein
VQRRQYPVAGSQVISKVWTAIRNIDDMVEKICKKIVKIVKEEIVLDF